jgi:hypothetical protein
MDAMDKIFSNINFKPNPFINEVEINFVSTTKDESKLIIINAAGKEVYCKTIQCSVGSNTITIDELSSLKSGIYFAQLTNSKGFSNPFKLVKE